MADGKGTPVQCLDTSKTRGDWAVGHAAPPPENIQIFANNPSNTQLSPQRSGGAVGLLNARRVPWVGPVIGPAGGRMDNDAVIQNVTATVSTGEVETRQELKLI